LIEVANVLAKHAPLCTIATEQEPKSTILSN
jgi:hypothetical protein